MENNKIKSYGLSAGLFVLCAVIGFFITKSLIGSDSNSDELSQDISQENVEASLANSSSNESNAGESISESTSSEAESSSEGDDKEKDINAETSEKDKADDTAKKEDNSTTSAMTVSTPKLVDGKYSFVAKCSGASSFQLYSNGGKTLAKESRNGTFSGIAADGSNYVVVALDSNGKVINKQAVSGMKPVQTTNAETTTEAPKESYAQLTNIINGSSNNYPRNIKISYENLEGDEEAHQSINNIRGYIKAGIWKSVTVVGATYSAGKVTSLTLHINR